MADRAQSSTSVSADGSPGRSDGRTVRSHSGQGRTLNNVALLVACMAIMIGSFWAFASYPDSALVWFLGLGLYALALLIPVGILHTSTAQRAEGGRTLAMDVPPSTEVPGYQPTAAEFGQASSDVRARDAHTADVHHGDKYGRSVE